MSINKEFFKFGEKVKEIPYRVLNERAVRAGAGIMFVLAIIGFSRALLIKDYFFLNFVIIFFFIDFFTKVFITPNLSLVGFIANKIVASQKPDYVGAIQKRFAWSIGLLMSGSMIFVSVIMQIRGIIPLAFCLTCLIFMWFETSFGICVGCRMYPLFIKLGLIKTPAVMPSCPGGSCELKK